jgi:hypothetical protein
MHTERVEEVAVMDHFKAVITEPNRPAPAPDKYGSITIPPAGIYFGVTLVGALDWAKAILPALTEGAFVTIYRLDEVEVERVTREEAISAGQGTDSGIADQG